MERSQRINAYLQMERSQRKCAYCHRFNHVLLNCRKRIYKHCHKKGPDHYQDDCSMNPYRCSHPCSSQSYTTIRESCNPGESAPYLSLNDLATLLK